ncbi:MAG: hypothetical protein ABIH34_02040 [Nanoarchaeota archaeon]
MAKKIISLSVEAPVYDKFLRYCKDQGFVVSKQVEIYMRDRLKRK